MADALPMVSKTLNLVIGFSIFFNAVAFADKTGSEPPPMGNSENMVATPSSPVAVLRTKGMPTSIGVTGIALPVIRDFVESPAQLSLTERAFLARYLSYHGMSDDKLVEFQLIELESDQAPYQYLISKNSYGNPQLIEMSRVLARNPALQKRLQERLFTLRNTEPESVKTGLAESLLTLTLDRQYAVIAIQRSEDWDALYQTRELDPELKQLGETRAQRVFQEEDFERVIQSFVKDDGGARQKAGTLVTPWALNRRGAFLWYLGLRKDVISPLALKPILALFRDQPDALMDSQLSELNEQVVGKTDRSGQLDVIRDLMEYRKEKKIGLYGKKLIQEHPELLAPATQNLTFKLGKLEQTPTKALVEQFLNSPVLLLEKAGLEQLPQLPTEDQLTLAGEYAVKTRLVKDFVQQLDKNSSSHVDEMLRSIATQVQYREMDTPNHENQILIQRTLKSRFERGIRIALHPDPSKDYRSSVAGMNELEVSSNFLYSAQYELDPYSALLMEKTNPAFREMVAAKFSTLSFEVIAEHLLDKQPQVRIEALRALAARQDKRVAPYLRRAYQSERDPIIRDLVERLLEQHQRS